MKKKLLSILGLLWGTMQCTHLVLDTSQKIDFANKRIIMIENYVTQKLNEKADLEQKLLAIGHTSNGIDSLAVLQARLIALTIDITDLKESIAIAKNSVKSLLTQK